MPRKQIGSWDSKLKRWVAMIDGERRRVTCKQLGLPRPLWTKEKSMAAAASYFEGLEPIGIPSDADLGKFDPRLQKLLPETKAAIDEANLFIEIPDVGDKGFSPSLANAIFGPKNKTTDKREYNLGVLKQSFLKFEKSKNNARTTYDEIEYWVNRIVEETTFENETILCEDLDVRQIDEKTVEKFYFWIKTDSGIGSQKKVFGFFKRLIKYLAINKVISLPQNLLVTHHFRFDDTTQEIAEYSDQEVINCLNSQKDRLRLYALLGLNCSMLPMDIANLSWSKNNSISWLDLKEGTITRKRIKHKKRKNAPVVTYPLWPSTLKLLMQEKSKHTQLVLTSKANTKLVSDSSNSNLITRQWKRSNPENLIQLRKFRTIGATKIGSNKEYLPYREVYLANKPNTVTDKHYDKPTQDLVNEMIGWLGGQFGQLEDKKRKRKRRKKRPT